jgi:hypothetical protein
MTMTTHVLTGHFENEQGLIHRPGATKLRIEDDRLEGVSEHEASLAPLEAEDMGESDHARVTGCGIGAGISFMTTVTQCKKAGIPFKA